MSPHIKLATAAKNLDIATCETHSKSVRVGRPMCDVCISRPSPFLQVLSAPPKGSGEMPIPVLSEH